MDDERARYIAYLRAFIDKDEDEVRELLRAERAKRLDADVSLILAAWQVLSWAESKRRDQELEKSRRWCSIFGITAGA